LFVDHHIKERICGTVGRAKASQLIVHYEQ